MDEDEAPELDVDLISIEGRFVLLSDDTVLPIASFYDDDGDECEPCVAIELVAGTDDYGWVTIDIHDTDRTIH